MKKIKMLLLMCTALLTLVGCTEVDSNNQEPEVIELTTLTFNGVEDTIVNRNSMYNILDGITVTGNDNVDYTDSIKVYLTGCGVDPNYDLYTYNSAECYVEYIVVVDGIYAKVSRTITIR